MTFSTTRGRNKLIHAAIIIAYLFSLLQLRTLNGIGNWDEVQDTIQAKISSLSSEYGATAQIITQELAQELEKIKRQKRLGIARLAEALFYNI